MGRKTKFNDPEHIQRRQAVQRSRRRRAIHQFSKYFRANLKDVVGSEEIANEVMNKHSAGFIDNFERSEQALKQQQRQIKRLKQVLDIKYLTPTQVAKRLKMPVQKVYKLLKSKKLKGKRTFVRAYSHYIADKWRVPEKAVEEFKNKGKNEN